MACCLTAEVRRAGAVSGAVDRWLSGSAGPGRGAWVAAARIPSQAARSAPSLRNGRSRMHDQVSGASHHPDDPPEMKPAPGAAPAAAAFALRPRRELLIEIIASKNGPGRRPHGRGPRAVGEIGNCSTRKLEGQDNDGGHVARRLRTGDPYAGACCCLGSRRRRRIWRRPSRWRTIAAWLKLRGWTHDLQQARRSSGSPAVSTIARRSSGYCRCICRCVTSGVTADDAQGGDRNCRTR